VADPGRCENCGRAAAGDLAAGLCPNCLLRTAIESGVSRALAPMLPKLRYFGDYELLEEVARGGMGVVYRARQVSLDRTVAVKMMRPGLLATEAEIQRFHTEAKTAAGLQHPNIVAIHEVGEFDGLHYFSMDFVEGPSLAELVQEKALSPAEAARYVRILAETVQYAHSRGILHRDLKPSNVLVDTAGRPRVTDFGLARPLAEDPGASLGSGVAGTPAYMAPEQAAGEQQRLGPATDVYALGAILYELLTGHPPFRGDNQMKTVRMVLEKEPASPRALNSEISRELEAVCMKCLRKEPGQRYGSAAELAEELARLQPGEPAMAPSMGWPGWKVAVAVVAVLALLLTVWAVMRNERADRKPSSRVRPAIAVLPLLVEPPAAAVKARGVAGMLRGSCGRVADAELQRPGDRAAGEFRPSSEGSKEVRQWPRGREVRWVPGDVTGACRSSIVQQDVVLGLVGAESPDIAVSEIGEPDGAVSDAHGIAAGTDPLLDDRVLGGVDLR
jgi:protein kinase-like protein